MERKNMTNIEFIKNMSVEEMANFIREIAYYEDDTTPMIGFEMDCKHKALRCCQDEIQKWLESEK